MVATAYVCNANALTSQGALLRVPETAAGSVGLFVALLPSGTQQP